MSVRLATWATVDLIISGAILTKTKAVLVQGDESRTLVTQQNASRFGVLLLLENFRSQMKIYGFDRPHYLKTVALIQAYTFRFYPHVTIPAAVQQARFLNFQAMECDDYDRSLCAQFIGAFLTASELPTGHPEIEAAPWGIANDSDLTACLQPSRLRAVHN